MIDFSKYTLTELRAIGEVMDDLTSKEVELESWQFACYFRSTAREAFIAESAAIDEQSRYAADLKELEWLEQTAPPAEDPPASAPPAEEPEHGDLIDLDAVVDCQYYDEMYEEWSIRTVTVRDVLYGCLEQMPPVVIPSNKEVTGNDR